MDKKNCYVKKTFEIDKELFHKFNVISAQQDKTHKEIINELLRNYVNKKH